MFLTDLILVAIYIGLVVMIKKPCKHKQVDIYYWSQVDTLMKSKARAWQSCHKIRIFNWPLLNIQPIKVTTNLCEVLQGHILCKTENTIYMKVLLWVLKLEEPHFTRMLCIFPSFKVNVWYYCIKETKDKDKPYATNDRIILPTQVWEK